MKTLLIDGVIGWDVMARDVKNYLDENEGEDVKVEISSPGGLVSEGLTIYNLLKNYSGQVHMHLMGMAASMASYVALAGDLITAESNAIFMIHNARGIAFGDHNALAKVADITKRMSKLFARAYAQKSGKSLSEITKLMDEETSYFGDEIEKAGFVDEVVKSKTKQKKADALALAEIAIAACNAKMKENAETENIEKVAAMLGDQPKAAFTIVNKEDKTTVKKQPEKTITEVKPMDLKTLKAEHPELYNELYNQGVEAGRAEEKDRVTAHLTMGKQTGAIDYAMKCIEDGKNMTEQAVVAEYMSKGMKKQDIEVRDEDNPDKIVQDPDKVDEKQAYDALYAKVMAKSEKSGKPVEQTA